MRRIRIDDESAGQRLDNVLIRLLRGVPKSHVYRLVRTGQVRVNGKRCRADCRVEAGDELRLPPVRRAGRASPNPPMARAGAVLASGVLYEDPYLLIVNKPSGLPVHGGSGLSGGLIEALRSLRREPGLELAHRLDRDTSGCLVLARRRSALRTLHAAFREGRVDKRYLALLAGRVDRPFTQTAALKRFVKRGGERHVAVAEAGRPALTRFRPVAAGLRATLVEVKPGTGRTHQIRVHAANAGHPVAGDARYGDKTRNREFKKAGLARLALHAERLGFPHPTTGRALVVEAPLPDDLGAAIGALTGAVRTGSRWRGAEDQGIE